MNVVQRHTKVERVLESVHTLGESPVWCIREQALYWVDLRAPALHRWDPATQRATRWTMPQLIGAVVVSARGGLLVALESGVYRFDPVSSSVPVSQVTSCAFGDDDLRTLYITTARQRLDAAQLAREPLAGALFAARVEVGGLPEPDAALG